MDQRSPGRLGERSIAVDISPMSTIVNDMYKSSLGPDATKKRYSHRSDDTCGVPQRASGHTANRGLLTSFSAQSNSDVRERCTLRTKQQLCSKWLEATHGNSMLDTYDNKENDSAVYQWRNFSPQKNIRKTRWPLEDFDPNSQDSGYEASVGDNKEEKQRDGFRFAEPSGVAPRRMFVDSRSPVQSSMRSSPQQSKTTRLSLVRLSSGYESMDDGFTELIDMDTLDDTRHLPSGISSLLSGDLVVPETSSMECDVSTTPEFPRSATANKMRRSLSLDNNNIIISPSLSKVRTCLFRSPGATSSTMGLYDSYHTNSRRRFFETESPRSARSFKRPSDESPMEGSSRLMIKKARMSKSFCLDTSETIMDPSPKSVLLQRSLSETEANIKSAVHRSVTDSDLTGDFSKPCVLPLAAGVHEDLKSITSNTLAALIRGEFADRVNSYKIVDCRYPYEYDGGHIEGAQNLYNKDLIEEILLDPLTAVPEIQPDTDKRNILVFHCEFSWERGPNLSRLLRSLDRQRNKEHYPALHYPEIYLLHGGYEQFYKEQKEFCSPQGYKPMRHPDHEEDLKQFRSKSKSWQGDKSRVNSQAVRTNLKRLGF